MGQVIPRQHPAVVLKSHYKAVRALLAAALVAIVALAATVVILANDDDKPRRRRQPISPSAPRSSRPPGTRFDGGPDEGTRGIATGSRPAPGHPLRRRPGRGHPRRSQAQSYWQQASPRTSYQPTPNEGFKARAGGPQMLPMGPSN